MQYPLFEMYIPALKTGSYLHDVDLLLKRQPELSDNSVNRGVELRKLWKSADDRFGEVVYKTLFMDKMMKEAGIFSSLSMGWNIGNVRQLGGGILDTAKLANKLIHLQKPVADDLTRKMLFTWVYTMNAALVGGLTTYAMTGQDRRNIGRCPGSQAAAGYRTIARCCSRCRCRLARVAAGGGVSTSRNTRPSVFS